MYVWIAAIIGFTLANADVFATSTTVKGITSQYAVAGLAAVVIVPSLAVGSFDLTIGANIGLSGVVFAVLMQNHPGMPVGVAIMLVLLIGFAIALANIVAVVIFEIDSFIGTLAMAAILTAIATAVSKGQFIAVKVDGAAASMVSGSFLGIQMPFWYLLVVVVLLAYWLERTTSGRYMYAVGFDRETARLTGLPVARLRAAGYLVSGVLGAAIGVVYAILLSSAVAGGGDGFLIPAFSAAFLGATQVFPGRFNTWGTLLAVLLLATGDIGITISGGPSWTVQLFEGLILLIAIGVGVVGLKGRAGSGRRPRWLARLLGQHRTETPVVGG
jgi:ribose transport system permease protein